MARKPAKGSASVDQKPASVAKKRAPAVKKQASVVKKPASAVKKTKPKRNSSAVAVVSVSLMGLGQGTVSFAAPVSGNVVGGTAAIATAGLETTITQTTAKAIINWQDFSISPTELVKFVQQAGNDSVTLNRVISNQISDIQGALEANGNIFLINPNGIVLGAGAQVDVAGLLATTFDIADADFMAGDFNFVQSGVSGMSPEIKNAGTITVGNNGFVYLIAPNVENTGHIIANVGRVTLAKDGTFNIDLQGSNLINFNVSEAALNQAAGKITNTGDITGEHVLLASGSAQSLMSSVVNSGNITAATSLRVSGGTINQSGVFQAAEMYLEVSDEGASIGQEGQAMQVDAGTLNAKTNKGHILVTDTAGGVEIGELDTGSTSVEDGLRAIVKATGGDITAAAAPQTNITAWTANLESDGAIGTAGQAVKTDVDVLNATAQDGGIFIEGQEGQMIVGTVTAKEMVTVSGQPIASTAVGGSDGNIVLSNGAVGTHDVVIRNKGDLFLTNSVSATNNLTLESEDGALFNSGDAVMLTGRNIDLSAGGQIGLAESALKIQSNQVNANAQNGGVYLNESNGLTVGTITAAGTDNHVILSATQGDIKLGSVEAAGGSIKVESQNGKLIDNNDNANNLRADSLELKSNGAIGTSTNSIETDATAIKTSTTTLAAGTYLSNASVLDGLTAVTNKGNVSVTDAGGSLNFNGTSSQLAVTRNGAGVAGLDLDFTNNGGDIGLGSTDLGEHELKLNASGAITQAPASLLKVKKATLSAGKNIGATGQAVRTDSDELDLTASDGDIVVDNSTSTDPLKLKASASGTGANGAVTISHGGDLLIDQVTARKSATLTATGSINAHPDSTSQSVTATGMTLDAASVGTSTKAFATSVTGPMDVTARSGGIFMDNIGAISLFDAEATGPVNLINSGDVILGRLQSGQDVRFTINGNVGDGNGSDVNIAANGLTVNAKQFGKTGDTVNAIEIEVDSLLIDTSKGGIYAYQKASNPLALTKAKSMGTGSDIEIQADGDIELGVVNASGNTVVLDAGGTIEDARPSSETAANVQAKSLEISADGGIGAQGDLALDVSYLAASGGTGGVAASNLGAIAVDAATLVGKGASEITIIATHVTILDNGGNVMAMDGGKLTLTATDGNIVFLNQNDTISLPGGGSITLTALAKSELQGFNGVIIAGNLTTQGGDISLKAESNITLGMLDTGGTGDVRVESRHGLILDGNGTDSNIRADSATLIANTPSLHDAEINRDTAIAEYSAKVAEANAKALQLEVLEQQLNAYIVMVSNAQTQKNLAQIEQNYLQLQVDIKSASVDAAQREVDHLNSLLKAATVVRNAAAIIAGAAQAIPFSGDAGADATFAVVDLALSAADIALDSYERYTLAPRAAELERYENMLDVAEAGNTDAATNLATTTTIRDTTETSRNLAALSYFKAVVARDASEQVRLQAVKAYDVNQDIEMSSAKPLGIEANRLDMRTSDGRALNSGVYLNSEGNLGLGDIESNSEILVTDVAGNISVVGEVNSPNRIKLEAGGAINGAGGTLVNNVWTPAAGTLVAPDLVASAGNGMGMDQAVNTQVDRLAVAVGNNGVNILNRNSGRILSVETLDGIAGVTGNGHITLDTDGDLVLKNGIRDTNLASSHTVTLTSGGEIIDGNGASRNVEASRLVATALKSIDLDTEIDEIIADITGTGGLKIRENSTVLLRDIDLHDGDVTVTAGSNITVGALTADAATGDISLTATGRIDDDQDNTTQISANGLTMSAGGAIGSVGANGVRSLDTQVKSVTATAQGDVHLNEQDDLDVKSIVTGSGDVTVTSATGSLNVETITTTTNPGDTITLMANQAINNAKTSGTNLTAGDLALTAGTGIGAGTNGALKVEAGRLEANGGTGGIQVEDQSGDLAIGGVTPNLGNAPLAGLRATGGDIQAAAKQGALTVNESVRNQGAGNITLGAGGSQTLNAIVQGNGNVTLNAGDSIAQNVDVTTASGNVAATALAGDIAMAGGTQTSATGNVSYGAGRDMVLETIGTQGHVTLNAAGSIQQNADITTANGSVAATATAGNIVMVDGTRTTVAGAGNIGYSAGGNLQLEEIATQQGDVTLSAGNSIAQNAHVTTANGNVAATALAGDITMAAGTQTSATGNVGYTAGNNLHVTEVTTGSTVELNANNGAISAQSDVARNVTAPSLLTRAANGIGSLGGALKTSVAKVIASITGAGDIHLNEADAVELTQVANNQGNVNVSAGGDITAVDVDSRNGQVALNSAGTVATTAQGRVAADTLKVTAASGIDLNTQANSAELSVTGAGNLKVSETDAVRLARLTTADGNINVAAGGRLSVDTVLAGGANRSISLNSGDSIVQTRSGSTPVDAIVGSGITLAAANGIGNDAGGALAVDGERLNAQTTAGDIRLNQADAAHLDNVTTGNGNVDVIVRQGNATLGTVSASGNANLAATNGALVDDGVADTRVSAGNLTLSVATGIGGSAAPIQTTAGTLTASVSQDGGIAISELDGLDSLTASTPNGDIEVRSAAGNMAVNSVAALGQGNSVTLAAAGGAIRDGDSGVANNITASQLALAAANGIGLSGNALDVTVQRLAADGGKGGVYINSLSNSALSIGEVAGASASGLQSSGGDIVLSSAGDLDIAGTVANTGGGNVAIHAAGDIDQQGNIGTQGKGGVHLAGTGDITMAASAKTTAGSGDISYKAGETLAVSAIETSISSRVKLEAPNLVDNAPNSGNIRAGYVEVDSPSATTSLLKDLTGSTSDKAKVSVNDRPVGGNLAENRQFVSDLLMPPSELGNQAGGAISAMNLDMLWSTGTAEAPMIKIDDQSEEQR